MERDFTYKSADGITDIHAVEWTPEEPPRAVLLIAHGMLEYIRRYTDFAEFMISKGIAVSGNDILGHGESVSSKDKYGYFADEDGIGCLIADMHTLRTMMEDKYPDIPIFYLGHSMGSFLIRQYIMTYGKGLAGTIVMGTGSQPGLTLKIGMKICRKEARKNGWNSPSLTLMTLSFGSFNKRIENPKTPADWLTKDESIVEKYINDPWCTFMFTVNGYYNMFLGMQYIQKKENEVRIPETLPILFVSGEDDPVGHYGKDVRAIFKRYKKHGIVDTSIIMYPGDRHEILNETDKDVVYEDILNWIENKL